MSARAKIRSLTWLLLLIIGCSGGSSNCSSSGGCGGGGCGGCSGCGGGCTLTPIPGGFPPAQRQVNSASLKLSQNGFEFIDTQASSLVTSFLGNMGGAINLPCTGPITVTNLLGAVNVNAMVCDLNHNGSCDSGETCSVAFSIGSMTVTPQTDMTDGSVNVTVAVNLIVNTGQIPVDVDLATPSLGACIAGHCVLGSCNAQNQCVVGTCGLSCDLQVSSSAMSPIPISLIANLKIDTAHDNLLAFSFTNLAQLTSQFPTADLAFSGGGCGGGLSSFTCGSILGNSTVEGLLISQLGAQITPTLTSTIDGFRCLKCDATNNNACPSGSTCDNGSGLCYIDKNADTCPPAPLGIEGRASVGSLLSSVGGDPSAQLDLSFVAGGLTTSPNPPSTYVQNQGLQLGFMGGSGVPATSSCVPPGTWTPPAAPKQMDFDAELTLAGPGTNLSSYQAGLSLADNFINKALFDSWQAGVLCLTVTGDTIAQLSSATLGLLITNLGELVHGDNVPMAVGVRPQQAPKIRVGRGTTTVGSTPGDPLISIEMDNLNLDFYAMIEERYARLFTLQGNLLVALSLDFDAANNTVTPSVSTICMQNVPIVGGACIANPVATVLNNNMNAGANLDSFLPSLLNTLVTPLLGSLLKPIAIPAIQGLQPTILGARGSIMKTDNSGYEHLAFWATLATVPPALALRQSAHTDATATDSFVPTLEQLQAQRGQPSITISANSRATYPGANAFEYSYRINGGYWHEWTSDSRFTVADPALKLSGHHDIEVRSRVKGVSDTIDLTPAHVAFTVDYLPPKVAFDIDPKTHSVITSAHDDLTADERLTYRYSVAGGAWSEPGAAQAFKLADLGVQPSLRVQVIDAAGHSAVAQYGASVVP